jgi:hypothetical protein
MNPLSVKATLIEGKLYNWYNNFVWRGGRVVEGARLESVCASNGTAGSNPVLSAIKINRYISIYFLFSLFILQYNYEEVEGGEKT